MVSTWGIGFYESVWITWFDIEGGRMIDFHSHVLPGIDDGSDCVEESLEMLHTAKNQGVSTMLATPHFLCSRCFSGSFSRKEEESL